MPLFRSAVNLSSPPAIGNVAPNSGKFANLEVAATTVNGLASSKFSISAPSRSPGSPVYAANTITAIQKTAGEANPVNITTATSHNYVVGDTVIIEGLRTVGCNLSALNGTWTVSAIVSATQFRYMVPGNNTTALATLYAVSPCNLPAATSRIQAPAASIGDITFDADYIYVNTAGLWKRAALSLF